MGEDDPPRRRHELTHLILAVITTLATVAGFVLALVATDKIVISGPGGSGMAEAEAPPPPTVTEVVTRTVTAQQPSAPRAPADCNREPNDERIEATPISLGVCRAALETLNDQDWYLFESPTGGPVTVIVEKAESGESGDVIHAALYENGRSIAGELIASDEPFAFPYTLRPESELGLQVQDGCSPPCGVTDYVLKLE